MKFKKKIADPGTVRALNDFPVCDALKILKDWLLAKIPAKKFFLLSPVHRGGYFRISADILYYKKTKKKNIQNISVGTP